MLKAIAPICRPRFFMSESHRLAGLIPNTVAIVTEFHTENWKERTGNPGIDLEDYDVIELVLHDGAGNRPELDKEMKALGLDVTHIACGAKCLPYQNCSAWDPQTIHAATDTTKKLWGLIWWPMYPCGNKPCDDTTIKDDVKPCASLWKPPGDIAGEKWGSSGRTMRNTH